jgi:hypothetical protein
MKKRSGLAFVFVFVLCLSLFGLVGARTEENQISSAAPNERFEHLRHTFAIEEEGSDGGGKGGHLAPSPSWECDVCEELVKEIVPILNYNRSMGETQFHREMDDLCVRFFADDGWLIGFCQYIISFLFPASKHRLFFLIYFFLFIYFLSINRLFIHLFNVNIQIKKYLYIIIL